MRSGNRIGFPAALLALLMIVPAAAADNPLLGDPYAIDGVAYRPADVPRLDEIGYAMMRPEAGDGQRMAGGEAYIPGSISAAHRTLPIPSYVEITSIDSGHTILVRVNDRGPMRNDRIVALSPGAASQLGLMADDRVGVRVRRVNPTEQERAVLAAGGQIARRMDAPPGLRAALARRLPGDAPVLQTIADSSVPAAIVPPSTTLGPAPVLPRSDMPPAQIIAQAGRPDSIAAEKPAVPASRVETAQLPPAAKPAPMSQPASKPVTAPKPASIKAGAYVVQVAALSSRARADSLAASLGGHVTPAGKLFRVRTGPYSSQAEARAALGRIHAKGYAEARLMANDARTAAALAALDPTP